MNKKVKNKLIAIILAIGLFHAVTFNPKIDNTTISLQDVIALASDNYLEADTIVFYPPFPPPGNPRPYPDTIPPSSNPFIRFIETILQ